ncbi:hypothetical protein [Phormidium nigroviride]
MTQLIYPHLGLFLYHLNDGVKEEEQSIPIPKEPYKESQNKESQIDGLCYSCSFGDTSGLLALYSVNDGDNTQPQNISCLLALKNRILDDKVVDEKIKISPSRKVGKSWMILGISPSSRADSLALEAVKSLTIGKFTETVKAEKFMGATVYEFWQAPSQWQDIEAENSHVVIILYPDKTGLDKFNDFQLYWMKLFLYRNKILWAYRNSQNQDIKQFLRQHLLPADTTFTGIQVRSEASTVLESGLVQQKKVLQESYGVVRQYANYITFLEVQLQTLETNLYNYKECRNSLLKEADKFGGITDTNLLKAFTQIPAKKCQMQITRDIAALSPGLKAQEIFINTLRGSADLEQVESDRNIENLIAAAGIGVGTASAVAGAGSALIKDFTQFYPIKVDKSQYPLAEPLSNLLIVILFSLGSGWVIGWRSLKILQSPHKLSWWRSLIKFFWG